MGYCPTAIRNATITSSSSFFMASVRESNCSLPPQLIAKFLVDSTLKRSNIGTKLYSELTTKVYLGPVPSTLTVSVTGMNCNSIDTVSLITFFFSFFLSLLCFNRLYIPDAPPSPLKGMMGIATGMVELAVVVAAVAVVPVSVVEVVLAVLRVLAVLAVLLVVLVVEIVEAVDDVVLLVVVVLMVEAVLLVLEDVDVVVLMVLAVLAVLLVLVEVVVVVVVVIMSGQPSHISKSSAYTIHGTDTLKAVILISSIS